MARGPKPGEPSKRRLQQALEKFVATRKVPKPREPNPAHREWLARHYERQDGRCAWCGIPMFLPPARGRKPDRRATLDHVMPLARKGADSEANTVAACETCNATKANMIPQLFRLTPFLIARKAYAAKVPEGVKKLTVTVRKRRQPAG
jgi:5-methylcytosine-specific restriction endonuclease McrA